ncbi:MAG: hypothetical protein WA432_03175 [Candidatus Babeliaceae bacterium]
MQLSVIVGTLFIFSTLTFIVFKQVIVTHELVHAYYEKEKNHFYQESLLLYEVGLFLENQKLRTKVMALKAADIFYNEHVCLFTKNENNRITIRVKEAAYRAHLIPIIYDIKLTPSVWIFEIMQ